MTTADPRTDAFLRTIEREHATTRRVLEAFPAAQAEFRPHERSSSAKQLAWLFVLEERMMRLALTEGSVLGKGLVPPPESWEEILSHFDAEGAELTAALRSATAAQIGRSVQFFGGPKQLADFPTMDFLWFMLHDQIHHRGQFSVYLRMAGGRVPSIYGPTADEPWT